MSIDTEKYELAKKLYLEGNSLTKISKEVGIERHKLSWLFKKDGIEVITCGKTHEYIEDIFDVIDTEEKAYWLGFLYADGNVVPYGKYEIKLSLAYKDLDHVKRFASFVLKNENGSELVHEYTARIGKKEYPSAKVTVTNKKMVTQLEKLGCIANKSLVLTFPNENQVPNHLVRHFIRGYFDGDGCAYRLKTGRQNVAISIVGTEKFLKSIIDIFKKICSNYGAESLYRKQNQQAWQLNKCNYKANKEIYEYLYKDATIYLDRKYEIFADLYGKL